MACIGFRSGNAIAGWAGELLRAEHRSAFGRVTNVPWPSLRLYAEAGIAVAFSSELLIMAWDLQIGSIPLSGWCEE